MESACSRGTSADGWMSHKLRFRWMKRRYVGFWQRSGGKYGRADEIDKKRNGPLTKRFSSANRFRNAFTTCAPQMSSGGRRTSHNQVNRSVRQADEFCQFSQCVCCTPQILRFRTHSHESNLPNFEKSQLVTE